MRPARDFLFIQLSNTRKRKRAVGLQYGSHGRRRGSGAGGRTCYKGSGDEAGKGRKIVKDKSLSRPEIAFDKQS